MYPNATTPTFQGFCPVFVPMLLAQPQPPMFNTYGNFQNSYWNNTRLPQSYYYPNYRSINNTNNNNNSNNNYRFRYSKTQQQQPQQQKEMKVPNANMNLINSINSSQKEFKILSYNIMRDDLHENHKQQLWKWKDREPRILSLILDSKADIVCLQECRDFMHHPIKNFLKQLEDFGFDYTDHVDVNNVRLRVVTLWRRDLFKKAHSRTFWLNKDNVESSEWHSNEAKMMHKTMRPVGFDVLIPIYASTVPFHVWNTHLGHSMAEKEWSVEMLPKMMLKYGGVIHPSVLCMDGNFFTKQNGLQQREKLCDNKEYELQDLTLNARLMLSTPKFDQQEIIGTFAGTSIDAHKPAYNEIGDPLDIIAGHNVNLIKSYINNKTMLHTEPSKPGSDFNLHPSDHFALLVVISFNFSNIQTSSSNKIKV